MPINAAGIHEYEEPDIGSPFSDTLNLLADSVTDKVVDLASDIIAGDVALDARLDVLEATSGVDLTVTNATKDHCRVEVDGLGRVTFRGEIWSVTAGTLCTIPVGYRPPKRVVIWVPVYSASNATTRYLALMVDTTGVVTVTTPVGTAQTASPGYAWSHGWKRA